MSETEDEKDGTLGKCDVVLLCGRQRFPCHRKTLSLCSPYFEAMFSSSMLESQSKEITLQDVMPSSLKNLIDFAYTKKFQATNKNVYSTLEAASMFHFDSIKAACVDFLLSTLSTINCLGIMCTGDLLGIPVLYRPARQMSLWEFSVVRTGKEFVQMTPSGLEIYLSDDGLKTKSEMEVFEAIEKWISEDKETRMCHLFKLLEIIRFGVIPISKLNEMIKSDIVKSDHKSLELVKTIKSLKMKRTKLTPEAQNEKTDSILSVARYLWLRPARKLPLVPAITGRMFNSEDEMSDLGPDVSYLDLANNRLVRLAKLTKVTSNGHTATGFRACVVGQRIYVMGGEFYLGCSNWNNAMWSLDTFTQSWTFESNLPHPRRHHCICVMDDYIYLIGGIGKFRIILNLVDKYDTNSKSWTSLQPLPVPTYSSACTAWNGKIYVLLSQVYSYDPSSNTWTTMRRSDLPNEHGFHSALSHPSGIYLVGHHSRQLILYFTNCVDRGSDRKAYSAVGEFTHPTSNACIVGDVIYSFSSNEELVVESYDVIEKVFRIVCKAGKNFGVAKLSNGCFALPMY